MAQLAMKTMFGAAAVVVSLSVAQLAAGSDLARSAGAQALAQSDAGQVDARDAIAINRTTKADRATTLPSVPSTTIAVRPLDQADSSILVRMPSSPSGEARRAPALRSPGRSQIACEPVVSVLTDIAKQLQPGRCVT